MMRCLLNQGLGELQEATHKQLHLDLGNDQYSKASKDIQRERLELTLFLPYLAARRSWLILGLD